MVQHMSFQDVQVPVPGFGAMGLSMAYGKADDEESMKTLQKAIDLGCTFWDSAVLYGSGHNEQLIGEFFKKTGTRDQVFFASKCGLECIGKPWTEMTITNSAAHINEYIDGTIERLGSAPDLYYLHRIDPDTPLGESIGALDKVRKEGKCKYIGLSECGVETLRKASAIAKIDAIQIEYSPWCTEGEETGLIDAARELGVAVIGYSPLSRGFLSGKYRKQEDFAEDDFRRTIPRFNAENMPKNLELLEKFESLAAKKGTSPTKLALAWVMAQGVIPIPGTKTSDRLEENFSSRDVELTDDEVKEIRRLVDESKPHGTRYDAGHMQTLGK